MTVRHPAFNPTNPINLTCNLELGTYHPPSETLDYFPKTPTTPSSSSIAAQSADYNQRD